MAYPTPYPDVNAVLDELLANVQRILGDQFVGMMLHGSLAMGDFNPQTSDLDFVVVVADELTDETLAALVALHARIAASDSKWATELEGSYIPGRALRRHDPAQARHPRLERGVGESLNVVQHDSDWVIQRHILREQGVVLAGPDPQVLIDPVSSDELRRAVLDILRGWWGPMVHDPARLRHDGYRTYAILTMCRALYTLEQGAIVSKPVAARWAQAALDARWIALIEQALMWQNGALMDNLRETQGFIQYTLERSRRLRGIHSSAQDEKSG